ncbi:hypothetical protein [Nakamurella endophytica]|uniref:Muconolactone isomerase domain-containing protein n=1 Tax=Nakamurella endophytica TaxID=1748367 RepID=A0A917SPW5_9ACTN|nr:hypothetical protein [Nakamurella endophytica]GGL91607.1 hypothetical protein GCM10011594_09230 [Nakamurella endophytica]
MKILAVSQNTGDPRPFLSEEAERTQQLVASGVVEQVFLKADWSGAVLILEAADVPAAEAALATLPLVREHVTAFSVTPLLQPEEVSVA